jgi:hypothetical protein
MAKKSKQLKNVQKQLSSVTDQLSNIANELELDKRLADVAGKVGLTERKKVLGVPVSKKRTDWGRIAGYGAAVVGAVAGARALGGEHEDSSKQSSEAGSKKDAPKKDAPKKEDTKKEEAKDSGQDD